jgi:hypothetical protein
MAIVLAIATATTGFAQDANSGLGQAEAAPQAEVSSQAEEASSASAVGQAQVAAQQAELAAKQARESAQTAKLSAGAAWAVWLFSPLSIALPWVLWWALFLVLVLFDGFWFSRSVFNVCERSRSDEGSIFFLLVQGAILVLGLSWLGVFNPAALLIENRGLVIKVVLAHVGIGVVFSALKGLWDLYFKYYKGKKAQLQERAKEVKNSVLAKLKDRCLQAGETFDANSPAAKEAVREAVENDSKRKDLLEKLRVRDYAPQYVFIGAFWEFYILWTVVFQYLARWAEILANIGQVIADFYNKKLHSVGLED